MAVDHIHAFLVHPRKGASDKSQPGGTTVSLSGKMFDLLNGVYVKSDYECDIDITFRPTSDGKQQNNCRDLVLAYLADPSFAMGKAIAERLEVTTDRRSGLGLLFLIAGKEGRNHKVVISRFPTDSAIYVEEKPRALTVEFLERVFMKNKFSYKAVVYQDASLKAGFWSGRAIDKQIPGPAGSSDYWISDFLLSEFTVTPAQGTRRLARVLREAGKKSSLEVKREITAAATLASGLGGQKVSINEFGERFNLSDAAKTAITNELKTPRLGEEVFQFDANEFRSLIAFRSVELNNGALLTAPAADFDVVFHQELVDKINQEIQFSTKGKVVNEKLKAGP